MNIGQAIDKVLAESWTGVSLCRSATRNRVYVMSRKGRRSYSDLGAALTEGLGVDGSHCTDENPVYVLLKKAVAKAPPLWGVTFSVPGASPLRDYSTKLERRAECIIWTGRRESQGIQDLLTLLVTSDSEDTLFNRPKS